MATFYLILVIVLFVLAISDLIVGVSNDAVNFLNSAVGARAASLKIIILVAALGVLVGATFSSGMMEVARKGIFHPEHFYFSEIMILFLAVMVTDVILLDTFNTFGMPTSTTVSIVFELLGAAVAISMVKIINDPNSLQIFEYINTAKALAIISGILVSVVIAFTAGVLAQYLSRLIFSFDYEARMKRYGAIWGGIGIMAIIYFMLIKGAKGAAFLSDEFVASLTANTSRLLLICFVGGTLLLYVLNRVFAVDILKVLVLVGTFSLAMAFAGNDLVNFIGVPLAGYNSYEIYVNSGGAGDDTLLMNGLAGQVPTPTLLLLLAGVIMVLTLYTSKKAKSVLRTSVDLGRQDEGYERFGSFLLSRSIVRGFSTMAIYINDKLPPKWQASVDRQFDQKPFIERQADLGEEAPAFDMIRASVTLVVASSLIAIGTNLKLPLSTTYVTFMVFMGSSLADGAWGRESAVYRVTGVLTVVGGWFFTAFSAFIVAFVLALIFNYGGLIAIALMLVVVAFLIYRTHIIHDQKLQDRQALEKTVEEGSLNKSKVINLCATQLKSFLKQYASLMDKSIEAMGKEDLTALGRVYQAFRPIHDKINSLKNTSTRALDRLPESELEAGHVYILVVDYLAEMAKDIATILKGNLDHVDNNHKPLLPQQIEELTSLHEMLKERYQSIISIFQNLDGDAIQVLYEDLLVFVRKIRQVRKTQIKRIKNREVGTRNSLLFLNHLGELRNLALFANRMVRVFDELIINPVDESDFVPSDIKKELKVLRKEVKSITGPKKPDPDNGSESNGDDGSEKMDSGKDSTRSKE